MSEWDGFLEGLARDCNEVAGYTEDTLRLLRAKLLPLLEAGETFEKFATHKTRCHAFPATSAAQIARDCDCGLELARTAWNSAAALKGSRAD